MIVVVVLGAFFGYLYGYNTDGFIFSSKICLFAGITLIMPSLFKFELSHVKLVWTHKTVLFKGLFVNFILLPIIALGIGFMTGDFGITAGLLMVALLSGGGMVMFWIKKSKADTSFGFLLLFINLLLVTLSLYLLDLFGIYGAEYFDAEYSNDESIGRFANGVLMLLIVIPFVISRVVRFAKPLMTLIQRFQKYISQLSIFIILFYLFGLQNTQLLAEVWDFDPQFFPIAFVAVVAFYALTFLLAKLIYNHESPQERAAFWHTVTRYLTLALVIATFTLSSFGVSMLLPIMFAYVVQIPLAVYINRHVDADVV
jgi:ACR3 family arsenite efflux pump ArsB